MRLRGCGQSRQSFLDIAFLEHCFGFASIRRTPPRGPPLVTGRFRREAQHAAAVFKPRYVLPVAYAAIDFSSSPLSTSFAFTSAAASLGKVPR